MGTELNNERYCSLRMTTDEVMVTNDKDVEYRIGKLTEEYFFVDRVV